MLNCGLRRGAAILFAAVVYWGAARVGFSLAFVNGTVSAVWPPTGFALALLVIGDRRMWPAILLGEFAADVINGSPLLVSLAFGVGSTCEALVGWRMLKAVDFHPALDRTRDVFALLGLAALLSTMVSATIGTCTLLIAGTIDFSGIWGTWHVWWLGDVTGDVIIAPILMVLATTAPRPMRGLRVLEAGAFAVVLALLAAMAHSLTLGIAYLVLPVLIWAALRFSQPGAVIANGVLAGAGVIAAAAGGDEMTRVVIADRVLFTQNFVAVGAITTLVLAATIVERDRAARALAQSEAAANAMAAERAAISQIATGIAGEAPPETTFARIVEQAAELLGAVAAMVVRIEDHTNATAVAAWSRPELPFFVTGSPVPLTPGSASALALHLGTTARAPSNDLSRFPRQGERIATPVRVAGRIWGTLAIAAAPGVTVPGAGERLLERFADLAGMAIVGAEARDQLLTEATTDALTGLANQRLFVRRVSEEASRVARYERALAVALIDIDDFKLINDTAGHLVGDRVLSEVGRRIASTVRGEALVARVGGDEFALVLPECDDMQAYAAAERARLAVSGSPILPYGRVTVSIGISEASRTTDGQRLQQLADVALYAAKLQGRDRCVRHSVTLAVEDCSTLELVRVRTLAGLRSLARVIDAKDPETVEHSKRVAELAGALATVRQWSPSAVDALRQAALVHDVGKVGVPDAILLAPRRLEPHEYEQMKQHAALSAQLAADVLAEEQVRWIRWHHERADGSGYPDGLSANQLPEGAKLLAIADAWDAMTTSRSYSAAKPPVEALEECRRQSGRQFSPEAVDALIAVQAANHLAAAAG